jgi:hypothetical protein
MRDFSTELNRKVLRLLINQLHETFEDTSFDIVDDYNRKVLEMISDTVKYFGIEGLTWDEGTFFSELVRLNPNYESEEIRVPVKNIYEIDVDANVIDYVTETYRHTLESYISKDEGLLKQQLMNEDSYEYWNGNQIHREVYDGETTEETISYITKL